MRQQNSLRRVGGAQGLGLSLASYGLPLPGAKALPRQALPSRLSPGPSMQSSGGSSLREAEDQDVHSLSWTGDLDLDKAAPIVPPSPSPPLAGMPATQPLGSPAHD